MSPPVGWHVEHGDGPIRFVIGMRWAHLWRLAARPWVPVAFLRMLRADPGAGLLHSRIGVRRAGPVVEQRWRDHDAVACWARDGDAEHQPPWARFAREEPGGTAAWGIWHEVGPATAGPASGPPGPG